MPTGTGKSLTFQIPAQIFNGLTIIISPLISLMFDQVQALKKKKISAEFINSSLSNFQIKEIYNLIEKKQIKLLYISPEKLENKEFLNFIVKIPIDFICLDEAHTMMWGLDFRASFLNIKDFINKLAIRPVVSAVTATATNKTIEEIKQRLQMANPKVFKTSFDRPNLYYEVIKTKNKDVFLLKYLAENCTKSGIIYTLTCQNTYRLYNFLKSNNLKVTYYHGQLSNKEKGINQMLFMNNDVQVIVCTISFALGIDKPDIRFVINYEMPSSIEDLAQMMGRASRDGSSGECYVLFSNSDLRISEYFINNIDRRKKPIKKYKLKQLKAIYDLCHTKNCLHKYICSYFGEELPIQCNNCSNCKKKTPKRLLIR